MKTKKMTMKKEGRTLLRVTLDKRDDFDYATGVRVANNRIKGLLPFTFAGNEQRPNIFYDISGLVVLPDFLTTKLSLSQFKTLFRSLLAIIEVVSTSGLLVKNLMLSPEHIYVDEDANIFLAYLPLRGLDANDRTVLDLLIYMAKGVRFVNLENQHHANDLHGYLKRQQVFSLVEVKNFLGLGSESLRSDTVAVDELFAQPQPAFGRDFVSEVSGLPGQAQAFAQQSVADNAVAAIRVDAPLGGATGGSGGAGVYGTGDTGSAGTGLPPAAGFAPVVPPAGAPLVAPPAGAPVALPLPGTLPASGPVAASQPAAQPPAAPASTPPQAPPALTPSGRLAPAAAPPPAPRPAPARPGDGRLSLIRLHDGKTWSLGAGSVLIGRSAACDIQVSDALSVSRRHALIHIQDGLVAIEDLGSANGTFVNAERIGAGQQVLLRNIDSITLGDVGFQVRI